MDGQAVKNKNRVYSTDQGKICPACNHPVQSCACAEQLSGSVANAGADGIIRITRETKGRKGAGVTIINGLKLNQAEMKAMAKQLKQRCGSGGAVKDGCIEIQGDHRETVQAWLQKKGFKVVLAGG
ncbi:MAG: translation initiation factor Sui1 [Gammaproteobacteria bacterium]|nr:translation initiation factor Sui1 [Gammaproteobacteria bacterium]MBT8150241.1 translation initiation factor Sui1 [Gammaproteobacteria bacterium]NNL11662.1 translation initiation factor Sui1 [Pseudomonadales bacterium]RZV48910.1 MAG: translation initiation factor Sui1 [Pseudomonadales bacterium]